VVSAGFGDHEMTRVLIVLVICLLVSQLATWVMLFRIQGDMAYENMRTVHRGEFGQAYR
jgi:hypothetical protein